MSYYLPLKHLHATFAIISISLLLLRFLLLEWRGRYPRILKILPHINDTILATLGVTLAVLLGLNPAHQPWLWQKLLLLFIYIGFGAVAMKARSPVSRRVAFGVAVVLFGLMAMMARTKIALVAL